METQSLIVLAVVWLIVAIPAIYFIVKGSRGDAKGALLRFIH